ncbi:F-box/LRR-repeat protein 12 [Platanthera zijinensis]|uniref:F-box/LRR-repeat protein 12 n=1 Tax=Platanthera zijinensis TaxID=2320716 RepID=A0AAP0B6C7_9ASPA
MNLTEDCLVSIFQNLHNRSDRNAFGLTCRRWLHIQNVSRRSLTFHFSHETRNYQLYERYLPTLLDRFPHLSSVSIAGSTELSDSALARLKNLKSSLQSLSLYCCFNITDDGLTLVAVQCVRLLSITLYRCNITDIGLEIIANYCKLLENLNVSYCMNITDRGTNSLSRGCRSLRFLVISFCRSISNDTIAAISKACPFLEEWNLAVCHEIGVLGWDAIGLNCSSLKVLHVNRCRNLCDRGLQFLRDGCIRLKVLHIHGCNLVSAVGLELFKLRRRDVEMKIEECTTIEFRIDDFLYR